MYLNTSYTTFAGTMNLAAGKGVGKGLFANPMHLEQCLYALQLFMLDFS